MIIAKLNTSSKQATMKVPYKVDMDCNGNIMPFNVFKNYSLTQRKVNWQQKRYNHV